MIQRAFITAWRGAVPWGDDSQVEQDLALSRALVEIFSEGAIADRLVLRGGTALHKLLISPPARYSEDIDLVHREARPIGEIFDAIRGRLDPWLGRPRRDLSAGNATIAYRFDSEALPLRPLRLKVEINTRERFSVLEIRKVPFTVDNPWFNGQVEVPVYQVDELMGTKLRALYQRKKGRDLFDLWLALERGLVDPASAVDCFSRYMDQSGTTVSRAVFEANLASKAHDPAFLADIRPLLASGMSYDAAVALEAVQKELVSRLPGKPWKGSGTTGS